MFNRFITSHPQPLAINKHLNKLQGSLSAINLGQGLPQITKHHRAHPNQLRTSRTSWAKVEPGWSPMQDKLKEAGYPGIPAPQWTSKIFQTQIHSKTTSNRLLAKTTPVDAQSPAPVRFWWMDVDGASVGVHLGSRIKGSCLKHLELIGLFACSITFLSELQPVLMASKYP